jgi:hypothetical protein
MAANMGIRWTSMAAGVARTTQTGLARLAPPRTQSLAAGANLQFPYSCFDDTAWSFG